jgi:hypothetical protein
MSDNEFICTVLREANEFYREHGKWPNELHVGSKWAKGYDACVDKALACGLGFGTPHNVIKHYWFMGMRVFREHWTHCVEWTKATDMIRREALG